MLKAEFSSGAGSASSAPAAAAAAAAASSGSGLSADRIVNEVLEVMSDKTGYEPDMIEPDFNLEEDLGVDSIKRVEILSEVQNRLGVEAQDVDALSRTQTVQDVIDALKAEFSSGAGSASSAPAAAAAAAAASSGSGLSADRIVNEVLEVMSDKTGYEPDMIEPDFNLEEDLGVDSIKRVEILSEVQNRLGVEAQDVDALSRTQTVCRT